MNTCKVLYSISLSIIYNLQLIEQFSNGYSVINLNKCPYSFFKKKFTSRNNSNL